MPSIITSIIGSVQSASAAHNAGSTAAAGQTQAGQTVQTGATNANNIIGNGVTAGQQNLNGTASYAGGQALGAAGTAAAGVNDAAANARDGALYAAGQAGRDVTNQASYGGGQVINAANGANALLNPYIQTGANATNNLNTFLSPGGAGTKSFSLQDMKDYDPGYAFEQQQGQQAIQRSAAARGGAQGGAAALALDNYSQQLGATQYATARGQFLQNQQQQYNMLSGAANTGLVASGQAGQNTIGANTYASNLGAGAAQYTGNMNQLATQYAGNQGVGAAQYGGNALINGTQYAGNLATGAASQGAMLGMQGALAQGNNLYNAGVYQGNTQIGAANDIAGGMLGAAGQWNQLLGGIGNGINSLFAKQISNLFKGGSGGADNQVSDNADTGDWGGGGD